MNIVNENLEPRKIALITVYFPTDENVRNIRMIQEQVDFVYICDNSPNNTNVFQNLENVEYIFFNKNLGIPKAFNYVLKNRYFQENDFIIFFDQDSTIANNHINNLCIQYNIQQEKDKQIGCIGPNFINEASGRLDKDSGIENIEVREIITSSMMMKFSILKQINFWNEEIFLDLADWDLCWRLKKMNYKSFQASSVVMKHSIGISEKKFLFFTIKKGNPIREYYQTRDCLSLLSKKYVPIIMKVRFVLMVTVRPLLHVLFLDNKRKRLFYIKRGIMDYKKNIMGEYNV